MRSKHTGSTVVVFGLGNIGSQLAVLLARNVGVTCLVLVDPDRYTTANLFQQNVRADDVGSTKVDATARAIAAIRPDLEVVTYAAALEDLPIGLLRAAVLVSCVDSRRARLDINRIARRLHRPWIDGAVQGSSLLARIATYGAGPDEACLECRYHDADYALVEPVYACGADRTGAPPTDAPVELGALTAAIQALVTRSVLAGDFSPVGLETYVNAANFQLTRARLITNTACRFDHRAFEVDERQLESSSPVVDLVERFDATTLALEGFGFVFSAACPSCAVMEPIAPACIRAARLPACARCGNELIPAGHTMRDELPIEMLSATTTLEQVGLQPGDILTLRGRNAHRPHVINAEIQGATHD